MNMMSTNKGGVGEYYQRFLAFLASSPNPEDKDKAEAAIIFIVSAMTMIISIIQMLCNDKRDSHSRSSTKNNLFTNDNINMIMGQ